MTADVLVVGRLLADIYPNQLRTPLSEIESFTRFVGGFAGNVATGLARLGVRTAMLSRVGDDGHGEYCRAFLEREGVDISWVGVDPTYRTALAFCEAWPPDHFPITYYRTPSCPDWEITFDDFPMDEATRIPWALLTGTGLARSPSRDVHFALAEERSEMQTVLDLDWRPMLWDGTPAYRAYVRALIPFVDVVVGNESEFEARSVTATPLRSRARCLQAARASSSSSAAVPACSRCTTASRKTSPACRSRSSTASGPAMPSAPR